MCGFWVGCLILPDLKKCSKILCLILPNLIFCSCLILPYIINIYKKLVYRHVNIHVCINTYSGITPKAGSPGSESFVLKKD